MSRVNQIRYKQFVQQANGAKIFEIHVKREDKPNAVVLKFNGRAPRGKKRVTGEWTIAKGERDEAALTGEIKAFLDLARKSFLVHREAGLEDEAFADPAQEESEKLAEKLAE